MRQFIDLITEGSQTFENELGHKIKLKITKKEIDGVAGVLIHIEGPDSETDNHITWEEAEKLYAELGRVRGKD